MYADESRELSYVEIGGQLAITRRTVERQLLRARSTLHELREDSDQPAASSTPGAHPSDDPPAAARGAKAAGELARISAASFPAPPAAAVRSQPPPAIPAVRPLPATRRPAGRGR